MVITKYIYVITTATTQVYEPSVKQALDYASKWCEQAEQRKQENQAHEKAGMEMNKLDKKAGILTGNSDGLDEWKY